VGARGLASGPAPPKSTTPPQKLAEGVRRLIHPDVESAGLTTTPEGEWAALIRVPSKTPTPIAEIERLFAGFPVIYETAPEYPAVARPAYPDRGE
jgi:hypothetical protein